MLYIGSKAAYLKPQQSGGDTSRVLLSVIPLVRCFLYTVDNM